MSIPLSSFALKSTGLSKILSYMVHEDKIKVEQSNTANPLNIRIIYPFGTAV